MTDYVFCRGDHVEFGSVLVARLGGSEHLAFDELHAWRYDDERGVWALVDGALESRIVQSFAGYPKATSKERIKIKASDVTGAIRLAHDQISRPGFFADAGGVVFADCFVRASTSGIEVRPHARENRARAGYAFNFDRGALPHRFLRFLSDLFRDDADRVEKEMLVQEFLGACILGIATRYQRCIMGTGTGENGKSALVDVCLAAMPPGTTTAIAPQDWSQEYRRAMLVGKHLNAVGELPERDILASESFKQIVTGDPIVGRVIRESPLMFRPIAGHFFAANKLPGTSDQTHGFWRRFLVLPFNRSFENDPTRDPHIVEKVLAELPAIVAWALVGAERIIREKGYTVPDSHHTALAEWRKNADQIALFLEAETRRLRPDEPIAWGTSGANLYSAYRRWSEANGHRAMASNKFGMRVRELGAASTHTKHGAFYPLAMLTAADRLAKGDGRDGLVTDFRSGPSPESRKAANA